MMIEGKSVRDIVKTSTDEELARRLESYAKAEGNEHIGEAVEILEEWMDARLVNEEIDIEEVFPEIPAETTEAILVKVTERYADEMHTPTANFINSVLCYWGLRDFATMTRVRDGLDLRSYHECMVDRYNTGEMEEG